MNVSEKLAALGLVLPAASTPPGAFRGAVRHGNTVTVSGQVPLQDGKVMMVGSLGADVTIEQGRDCARCALLNALAQVEAICGSLDLVEGFVRLGGYVAATPDFTQHGKVIDGASELLRDIFGDRAAHARVAMGMASLPRGVPVEIELTVILRDNG